LQDNNFGNMMFLVFLFVWMVYPFIVISLRPNIFKLNKNWEYSAYMPTFLALFFYNRFLHDIGKFNYFRLDKWLYHRLGVVISILLGVISETIILLPDKLEKYLK